MHEPNATILKTSTILAVAAAGAAAFVLANKANAAGKLNFYPANVSDVGMSGTTPYMTVGIRVQNTSGQQLVVRSLAGNVYSNSYLIGNFSSFTTTTISPNSQVILYINVTLSLIGIVQDIINAFQYHTAAQLVQFEGNVNVETYQVPLVLQYNIGG